MKFLFDMRDWTVDTDVGMGDFSLVQRILHVCTCARAILRVSGLGLHWQYIPSKLFTPTAPIKNGTGDSSCEKKRSKYQLVVVGSIFFLKYFKSTYLHPFQVTLPNSRTLAHKLSFIPRTSQLWNSLPPTTFPETYNLSSFKSNINKLDLISLST